MRLLSALLLIPASLAATSTAPHAPAEWRSEPSSGAAETTTDALPPQGRAAWLKELGPDHASMLRFAASRLEQGDYESALIAYQQVGRATEQVAEREAALAGLARAYRRSGDLVKAAATYERLLADHPGSVDTPMYLLELGRTLRALGTPKLAISRFYNVLNAVIKVPNDQADNYRQIARTAQYEIAETHYQTGNFEDAARFYSRLNLLDLAPDDQRKAEFKAAQARSRAGQHEKAIAAFRQFIEHHPDGELGAEARFQLATLLQRLDRSQEAMAVTLELLKRQQAETGDDAERWAYWQRRTGNQLANEFYRSGDFTSAFTIYQRLSELGGEPAWRLPVLYQMALCQERLLQNASARALYQQIEAEAAQLPDRTAFSDLSRMVAWRLNQLDWNQDVHQRLDSLSLSTVPGSVVQPLPNS